MKLVVEPTQRKAKMRSHTATHLLHAQLEAIFPMTKQAGSLVEEDYLRFDFVAERALSDAEIAVIEDVINGIIRQDYEVQTKEMSYQEATQTGAKAFFEEKYGDKVRVVQIGEDLSIELCGGTHCASTGAIGCFKVVGQEAVASGTKRIVAVTGPKVYEYAQELDQKLSAYASLLDVPTAQLDKKLEKTIKENKEQQEQIESLQKKLLKTELHDLAQEPQGDLDLLIDIPQGLLSIGFKNIVNEAKQLFEGQTLLLRASSGQFALIGGESFSAKDRAQEQGLKGGGSPNLFQGKDEKVLAIK